MRVFRLRHCDDALGSCRKVGVGVPLGVVCSAAEQRGDTDGLPQMRRHVLRIRLCDSGTLKLREQHGMPRGNEREASEHRWLGGI